MGRMSRLGNALYEGDVSVDFVGRKWLWYAVSVVIVLAAASGLLRNGLNFGIEFEGGVEYQAQVSSAQTSDDAVDSLRETIAALGIDAASNPQVTTASSSEGDTIRVQTEAMPNAEATEVRNTIAETVDLDPGDISTTEIGPSWGAQVAERALTGLVVFLVLVVLFIWAYFREWKMSVAALVALAHDLIITIGVYAWSGFEVTPSTVTGLLTILGFSLYDTVVVFDKVRENTRMLNKGNRTYAQQANLAVNQTLVRSINTSIVALLPVAVILWVSITTLGGSGSLQDLSLSLFVGMAAGAYSSVFIATPLAVHLKQGEKEITRADERARSRARRTSSADRYADVPASFEGVPADQGGPAYDPDGAEELDEERPARSTSTMTTAERTDAMGSGRTLPDSKAPMGEGGSSKRSQPRREPRSKRK